MGAINASRYANDYMDAAMKLMDAIAEPAAARFNAAHAAAVRAISNAYGISSDTGLEWQLGQKLAESIRYAANAHGHHIDDHII